MPNEIREKRLKRKNAFINKFILIFQTISVFCSFTLIYYQHFRFQPWSLVRVVGLVIAIFGYIMWCISRFEIGESFSYFPQSSNEHGKSSKLVKTGLYSLFSHPIYLFSSLTIFGYILFIARLKFLLIFIVLIPAQMYRIRQEQTSLLKAHGKEYIDYMESVLV